MTYTIGSEGADQASEKAKDLLVAFLPGFLAWTAFSGTDNLANRADLVVWASASDAQRAAQAVGSDPALADFRASITGITSMAHYSTDDRKFVGQF